MPYDAVPIQQTPVPNLAAGSPVSARARADTPLCAIEQCANGWASGCVGNAGIGEALAILEMPWVGLSR